MNRRIIDDGIGLENYCDYASCNEFAMEKNISLLISNPLENKIVVEYLANEYK